MKNDFLRVYNDCFHSLELSFPKPQIVIKKNEKIIVLIKMGKTIPHPNSNVELCIAVGNLINETDRFTCVNFG